MSASCTLSGCAVAETGRCALERDPATCPHAVAGRAVARAAGGGEAAGAPVLASVPEAPRFPSSRTLAPDAVGEMMGSRRVTVVGILGEPNAGKTACLVSLYLLVSNARLHGWSFADSRSLMAFEDLARGARAWNQGNPPEQMTTHTEMADDRRPGFLHLRLRRGADGRCVDLALPDLPGEWTKALVRSSQWDRFEFLESADAIWIVVDGRALGDRVRRQGAITRVGQLAGRLAANMGGAVPPIVLVVTHRDEIEVPADVEDRLGGELAKHGLTAAVAPVAAFSDNRAIPPGDGVAELIDATAGASATRPDPWPRSAPDEHARAFLSFREPA